MAEAQFFVLSISQFSSSERVVASCGSVAAVPQMLADAKAARPHDELILVERIHATPADGVLPPELARAVVAWNDLAGRTSPKLPTVRSGAKNYIGPYRKWKKRNDGRTYLLEEVVAAVAKAGWTHSWIQFGWLLGSKDGTLNCEKVLNGNGFGGKKQHVPAAGGEEFEVIS